MVSPHRLPRRQTNRDPGLLTVYATGLAIVINLRQPVLVRIMPNRITLYTLGADGLVHNTFRMVASNRGKQDARSRFRLPILPPHELPEIPMASF